MLKRHMQIVPCPGCGRDIADTTVECPHCHVPVMALLGPRNTQMPAALVALLAIVGGLGVLSMVAAVAVAVMMPGMMEGADADADEPFIDIEALHYEPPPPAPLSSADSAMVREAMAGLSTLVELQHDYAAKHGGEYTQNLTEPGEEGYLTGWRDPGSRYYTFRLTKAGSRLCLDAIPATEEARPVSIDGAGAVYDGSECDGRVLSETAGADWLPAARR